VLRRVILGIAAFGLLYLYLVALSYTVGAGAAWPTPRWWIGTFSAHRGAILSWLWLSHLGAVLIVSFPFAWIVTRVYGRFSTALSIAFALATWGIFDAPLALDAFRSYGFFAKGMWLSDTVEFVVALPAMVLLLRRLSSNHRFERSPGLPSSVSRGGDR
jgi:hypothetical protein